MAALQSMAGGQVSTQPSFKDILSKGCPNFQENSRIKKGALHKGEPALFYTKEEISILSEPLKLALVGKFSKGRPHMEALRRDFKTIGFKGGFHIGLLDNRHVLIRFDLDEDYHRCWMRATWSFGKFVMRVLKWTPSFTAEEEPPIAPVWISLHHLPLYLFGQGSLFSIAALLGQPLKLDVATQNLSRPSVARICVELNLLEELPKRIWIGTDLAGFWQQITYDNLPDYCYGCKKIGHSQLNCREQKQQSTQSAQHINGTADPLQQVWRPKERVEDAPSSSGLSMTEKGGIPINIPEVRNTAPPLPSIQEDQYDNGNAMLTVIVSPMEDANYPSLGVFPEENYQKITEAQKTVDARDLQISVEKGNAIEDGNSGQRDAKMKKEKTKILDISPIDMSKAIVVYSGENVVEPREPESTNLENMTEEDIQNLVEESIVEATQQFGHDQAVRALIEEVGETLISPVSASMETKDTVSFNSEMLPVEGILLLNKSTQQTSKHALTDEELVAQIPDLLDNILKLSPDNDFPRRKKAMRYLRTISRDELKRKLQESKKMLDSKFTKISEVEVAEPEQSSQDQLQQSVQSEQLSLQQEHDDFVPVVSKKSRRRKDYSSSLKTMQTRQLPRKDYSKLNAPSISS